MTFEEMLGGLMASQARIERNQSNIEQKVDGLQRTVNDLANKWLITNQEMKRLPCNEEQSGELTQPDCPALMDAGEDEPHSALTEQVSFHAKGISYRGPAFVALGLAALAAICVLGYLWWHSSLI